MLSWRGDTHALKELTQGFLWHQECGREDVGTGFDGILLLAEPVKVDLCLPLPVEKGVAVFMREGKVPSGYSVLRVDEDARPQLLAVNEGSRNLRTEAAGDDFNSVDLTHPWRVWRCYPQRARSERHIRELLYDYPLAKIPTADWIPNVAFFQLRLFAFDLVHYFRRLWLPPGSRTKTLKTLRQELLAIPGRRVKTGNRYRLKLARDYHFERTFRSALAKIREVRPVQVP
jgi:hypothetical protein